MFFFVVDGISYLLSTKTWFDELLRYNIVTHIIQTTPTWLSGGAPYTEATALNTVVPGSIPRPRPFAACFTVVSLSALPPTVA